MADLNDTLKVRGSNYGPFSENARVFYALYEVCEASPSWKHMPPVLRKGVLMICSKLSRMLTGDPFYPDNWHDIAGYAKLGEDECLKGNKDVI